MSQKPIASLSLDLDNKWSYLKTHGDPRWESFPSYLEMIVPRFLALLDELGLKITVFVVGQDAAIESNQAVLRSIADAGHEIGNHSFHHEPWLHLYSPEQLDHEFELSEQSIEKATGQKTVGFRGPGFSLTDQVLKTMLRRGYEYDCSTFPTYLGPIARMYYFAKSSLNKEEQKDRKELFGRWSDGLQSNKPYYWDTESERLLEIPVTTFPLFKVPIHSSYLLYLATFSKALSRLYFWKAMTACRIGGVQPSFLLHPLDFMGFDDDGDLDFFPGMKLPGAQKVELMRGFLGSLSKKFQVLTMREHAHRVQQMNLGERSIQFARMGIG